MLPIFAILAKAGLPLLVDAVGSALGAIDNPVAKTASSALGSVREAIAGQQITPEQIAESNRHIETMAGIESEEAKAALAEINATFRSEVQSEDAYVRRWRPTFGYAVALTWTATMGAVAWAIVAEPTQAPTIITALVNTSPIWGIALAVLGIAVHKRSQDKQTAAGVQPVAAGSGLFSGLFGGKGG